MEEKEVQIPKIDIIFLVRIWLRYAKKFWAMALVLAVLGAAILGFHDYRTYRPMYDASVSFTVKLANPLYGSMNSYNNAAARQLHSTFPYILRSQILIQRVREYLGTPYTPMVYTSVLENSNIFTIQVRDTDPERAYAVLQAVIVCYPQVADYVVGATELTILDDSGIPTKPVNAMNLADSVVLGAFAGVAIWMVLLLLLTLSRRTIHNEDELKRTLNYPCLGIIPATKVVGLNRYCPLMHHDTGKFGFSESVRLLQMHLDKELQMQKKKVVMVSGAIPGEGKTTIAVNLAIASAKRGRRTLLVDCDMFNSTVFKTLEMENPLSLKGYIKGEVTAKELMNKTAIRHLYCMSADMDVKDVKVKRELEKLMKAAREAFDIIIMDTPPCSLMVDAAEVADLADCVLMVIRQDYASRDQIIEGVRLLTDNGIPLIGCAINGVTGNLAANGYRYGNGYGYGYGYGYGSQKDEME